MDATTVASAASLDAVDCPDAVSTTIDPTILYFGTPVVLVSTTNENGSANLAPISSIWWLGHNAVIGMSSRSHTVANLRRQGECVLNLASVDQVDAVDRLALTTGSDPVPAYKAAIGCRHVRDKFALAGLTPTPAEVVRPPRAAECPVQLEGLVRAVHPVGGPDDHLVAVEVAVARTHVHREILRPGHRHHIDPDRWRPLMMSFLEFYGLGERLHPSRLADAF
ncbi:MAG: flavin reductase family protein [Actinomycetota bacterium]|nr:flavin reductase family protein [Actinomycetota bacterium]